ncbi:MAG: hypothetical protein ACTH14_06705 [Jeotgalicoccus sp.]
MEIKNVKLISGMRGWGRTPEYDVEVEQRLTVNSAGRVWISYYIQGDKSDRYTLREKKQFTINKNDAAEILNLVSQHFLNEQDDVYATDVDVWSLVITETDNTKHEFSGSMLGVVDEKSRDLTRSIKKILGLDDLVIFGNRF